VISTDADGRVDFLNPVAENLTGWSEAESKGKLLGEVFRIVGEETRRPAVDPVARCLSEGRIVGLANHTVLVSRSGLEYAIEDSAAPMFAKNGGVLGVVLVFKDVTAARKLSQQVSYQATHDTLTGLINRCESERRLRRVLDTAQRVDRWVIGRILGWFRDHPSQLEELGLCSINLSGLSLSNETFLPFVIQELESSGVPPKKICFEITETVAIANLVSATNLIKALRHLGCCFALDDFGSGLSSFAYLKNLPVDFLKIDGVFVKDVLDDPMDLAMVRSINEIGHVTGKKTIAEFVENDAILEKLREIGIDYAQGYGIGRPCPLNELLETELVNY